MKRNGEKCSQCLLPENQQVLSDKSVTCNEEKDLALIVQFFSIVKLKIIISTPNSDSVEPHWVNKNLLLTQAKS